MSNARFIHGTRETPCLTVEDFFSYVAHPPEGNSHTRIEAHLAECPKCREELAGLLSSLSPESGDAPPEPADACAECADVPPETVERLVTLVQETSRRERREARRTWWIRSGLAAAAVIALVGAGSWGIQHYSDGARSRRYIAQAEEILGGAYEDVSPSGLRLDLPFQSRASLRSSSPGELLAETEALYHRALGVREGMAEAHFGLGYVYLSTSRFQKARAEFQRVLEDTPEDSRSLLGRGAASYEEALQSTDPFLRDSLLKKALADFDALLARNPSSPEARYNRIWALFHMGRHQEALQDIGLYLAGDPGSIWSAHLKDLQVRIRLSDEEAVQKELEQAAELRDWQRLAVMARLVPHQVPAAIRYALRRSIERQGAGSQPGGVPAPNLRWAAEVLEQHYSAASDDRSYASMLAFYAALSRDGLRLKMSADERFQRSMKLYRDGNPQSSLKAGEGLGEELRRLGDFWQLVSYHHLRGNCYYYLAEFREALHEYQRMLETAYSAGAPDLIARALAGLVSANSELRNTQEALACATRLQALARTRGMIYWQAYASRALGIILLDLNQVDRSVQEFAAALAAAQELHDADLWVNTLEHLGLAQSRSGHLKEAQAYYDLALRYQEDFTAEGMLRETAATKSRYASLLWREGELAFEMGSLDRAESAFERGIEFSRAAGMEDLEARHRLGRAQVWLKRSDPERAEQEILRCLEVARPAGYRELQWKASYLQGMVRRNRGDPVAALACFEEAVKILESMRWNIRSEDLRRSFLTDRVDPYAQIVSILYHTRPDKAEAAAYADRAKSVTLVEYLQSGRIPLELHEGPPRAGRDAGALAHDFNLLQYFLGPDELFIFLATKGNLRGAAVAASPKDLARTVDDFAASVQNNDRTTFAALSRTLYDMLVAPVFPGSALERGAPLVILPDGPLHRLSFAALANPEGRYLLEDCAISYAPSCRVLEYCLGLNKGNAGSAAQGLLLIDGSRNLVEAREEIAGISRIYGGLAHRMNSADLPSAGRILADAEILHFAGHSALENGKPALLLGGQAGGVRLDSQTISSWKLDHDRLVNLAGCSTGTGPLDGREPPWGLIPALLNAGAPAVIVSQLPVDDLSTRQLNVHFYSLLSGAAVTKVEALRRAQLSLLNAGHAQDSPHPISWVPYILVGDPR